MKAFCSSTPMLSAMVIRGKLIEVKGSVLHLRLPGAAIGDLVSIRKKISRTGPSVMAQIIALTESHVVATPLENTTGLHVGAEAVLHPQARTTFSPMELLGCALTAEGHILKKMSSPSSELLTAFGRGEPLLSPLQRDTESSAVFTGIRAIDIFCTVAEGQRLVVLAPPGAGKSTLLQAIAKHSSADITVMALIGERGREVSHSITKLFTSAEWQNKIVVYSTSNEPAAVRTRALETALQICEAFRDCGKKVLLVVDSLTRLCRAMREVGLAAGEIPVRRGYPPSVFSDLPKFLERIGKTKTGSITAFCSMLVTAELEEDPMVEEIVGLVDGHIVLSKDLADRGHYPAIEITRSLSRLARGVQSPTMASHCAQARTLLDRLNRDKELLLFGAAADDEMQRALSLKPKLDQLLTQDVFEFCAPEESNRKLQELFS